MGVDVLDQRRKRAKEQNKHMNLFLKSIGIAMYPEMPTIIGNGGCFGIEDNEIQLIFFFLRVTLGILKYLCSFLPA